MKKFLVTRKLLQSNEDRLKEIYDVKLNSNDELYSQSRLIELSQGRDGILSALTDKLDVETINKLQSLLKYYQILLLALEYRFRCSKKKYCCN